MDDSRDTAPYHRPRTLAEAVALLARGGLRIAAGCTDLFPATEAARLSGGILDLTGIAALNGIGATPEGWRIGAATSWSAIREAALPPAFDALRAAAAEIGSVQIQNAGTIGGNLCNASPAADGVPCLQTMNAIVEIAGPAGTRHLPVSDFIIGPRRTALSRDEILCAVLIPKEGATGRSAFLKLGARRHMVISIVMVAARLCSQNGRVSQAAVSVGACAPVAVRLKALEAALIGQPLESVADFDPALVETAIAPLNDIRGDAPYRRAAAVELTRRALHQATGGSGRVAA